MVYLSSGHKLLIRTMDLVWTIESQVDEWFEFLIYPNSTQLLSCDMTIRVTLESAVHEETKSLNYELLICKFDENNVCHTYFSCTPLTTSF